MTLHFSLHNHILFISLLQYFTFRSIWVTYKGLLLSASSPYIKLVWGLVWCSHIKAFGFLDRHTDSPWIYGRTFCCCIPFLSFLSRESPHSSHSVLSSSSETTDPHLSNRVKCSIGVYYWMVLGKNSIGLNYAILFLAISAYKNASWLSVISSPRNFVLLVSSALLKCSFTVSLWKSLPIPRGHGYI